MRLPSALALFLVGLLWATPRADAHNWMTSPARGNEAGENNGFNGFQSPPGPQRSSRIHTQVGPGQRFPVEWAAGHGFGSKTYFAVIKASDEPKLEKHTLRLLDDYIDNAPASAQDYMKDVPVMHVANQLHSHPLLQSPNSAADYTWIPSIPETKGKRPSVFRQKHFGPNPTVQLKKWSAGQDKRVMYKSAKYPWILSAHRFLMKYDYPEDADTTMMEIPKELGAGKYIVAYQWSGYYDMIDVNVLPVPSTDVFGKPGTDPSGYDRTDHCEFINSYASFKVLGCKGLAPGAGVDTCDSLCTNDCDGLQVAATKLDQAVTAANPGFAPNIPTACDGAKNAEKVCYALKQGTPIIGPSYRLSADPEDPVFYNSCYTKSSGWTFEQVCSTCPATTVEPGWAFGSRCISCADMRTNTEPGNFVPTWKLLGANDVCRACDNQG